MKSSPLNTSLLIAAILLGVVPRLPADRVLGAAIPELRSAQSEVFLTLFDQGRPIFQYRFDGVPHKPYIKELFTPQGVQVLRDAPADHIHHHGLMFAVGVNGLSFWAEERSDGLQVPEDPSPVRVDQVDGIARAGFDQSLAWRRPGDAKILLSEQRTLLTYASADLPATLVTWRSRLTVPEPRPSLTLTGSHYYGLGMRFVQSMDGRGRFLNAGGAPAEAVRGEERLTRASWCAYVVAGGDFPLTVALFDHPRNPRHPATMFTMPRPFAYQAATLNVWKEPLTLSSTNSLDLIYGIAAWDGAREADEIESLYRRWVTLTSASSPGAE